MTVRYTALFSAALALAACGKKDEQNVAPNQAGGDQAQPAAQPAATGNVAAPASDAIAATAVVEIIEFSDFECPFCSRVNPTLDELKKTYGDKLKVTFMHQPLSFHQNAKPAALAAEAARKQGKFQEMHDKLFADQKNLTVATFDKYATELGLDLAKFKADYASPELSALVDRHQAIANAVGATGTPAFFINGKNLRGAQPVDAFKALIDEEVTAAAGKSGEAFIKERLQANNAALFGYVYEGKAPPAAPAAQRPPVDKTIYKVEVDNAKDAIKGNVNAPVTLVVFSEFQCPFCKKIEPTFKELEAAYGDKIRIVFKHNPLPFHADAFPAAQAALAAKEQGKFWEYHDKLWENQTNLKADALEKYATELGLDLAKFKADMANPKFKDQILADQELAGKVTARGTPNTFINGRKLTGAKPTEEFKEVIDEELKRAEAAASTGVAADKLYEHLIKDGKVFEPLEEQVNQFDISKSPVLGNRDAKIQVVEFSDFQCPFCQRVSEPLKELQAKYGNDLVVVFKHFPLSFHKEAKPAAIASMCANEQGKFWEYGDQLFANMKTLQDDNLKQYAAAVGLDANKFAECYASGKYDALVEADMEEGRKAGVRGTPTIYINGRKFNSPSGYSVEAFSAVIDKYVLKK